ncbi:MAG: hypothetical protein HN820_03610 [Candidatus Marinimicrobia bacterium]|jgi:N-acetylglucosamine kinase-like BadF-type ATPase|nr:hypothetical protein [Candidatus Neomarinimicrobiota bacterium]MBT7377226.1 hypothetical protein [Candidatus Neomarinimicrobiota bacterium]
MNTDDNYYIIGIDGGATNSRGVLFTNSGATLSTILDKGTNIALDGEAASKRIASMIEQLCEDASIDIEDVDAVGLGLAGASDEDGRDMVFKVLDGLKLSRRSIIMNDAEASYEVSCPGGLGILVTVGTGIICIGRNESSKIRRVAGEGHAHGDIGSGFWIGKKAIMEMALNESSVQGDEDLSELMTHVLDKFESSDFNLAIEETMESEDSVPIIASLAEKIIEFAESGNEMALKIVQEGSSTIAEYILQLVHDLELNPKDGSIILAGNGSVIRNDFYRKTLNDALQFDFPNIKWTFSTISNAYGAGLLAARLHDVDVKLSQIIQSDYYLAATR